MKRATVYRTTILIAAIALLEALCLGGTIDRLTMQPPHRIVLDLVHMLSTGTLDGAIVKTLTNAGIAVVLAIVLGIGAAVLLSRFRPLRDVLDPLFATYYAIPVFAFYPLLIIVFGLGDTPQILMAFMLAVIAVIVNTLNGLDRVPRVLLKTARINQMGPIETALKITLPSAAPYILTGIKLAVAYALIGIIGAEFILSRGGMGYEISFAYTNFDNATMYPLILLILMISIGINMVLAHWEKRLMLRRGQG